MYCLPGSRRIIGLIPAHPRFTRMYWVTHSVAFQAIQNTRNINNVNWVERGKDWDGKKSSGYLCILIKILTFAGIITKNNVRNEIYQTMPIHRPCIVVKFMQRLQETQRNVKNTF